MSAALPDNGRIRIRSLQQSEQRLVHDLYACLSPRTRYLRFFSATPVLPDPVARLLLGTPTAPALVAECEAHDRHEAVGLASLAAVDQETAEVGLVVRDDWQRQRVGTTLATRALEAAEAHGFRHFVAHTLVENHAIFKLLRALAADVEVSSSAGGGVIVVRFGRRP